MSPRLAMLVAGLVLLSAGCAVHGKPFERAAAPSNTAVIYVYRPYSFFGSLIHPTVQCGDETAAIGPGGYHAFVVPAGHVTCRTSTETADELEFDAEPRIYYVRELISMGVIVGHPQLNPMDTDEAQSEIQTCCMQQP
jgi:hypothetical protein